MTELHVDVGTARLATTDLPATTTGAPTIVALHAGVADRRAFHSCTPAWNAAGWRVVSYDRRGFGASSWDAGPHDHLTDLVAVMDERGVDEAVLVGNSMGGGLAVDVALTHPDRVRALVLVASALSGQTELLAEMTGDEVALGEAIGVAESAGDVAEVNRLECHYWLDGPGAPEGRVADGPRDLFLDMNGIALRAPDTGEAERPASAWDRLREIDVPTLVILGALDEREVIAVGHKLAAEVSGAELVEFDDSAHLPMLDAPDRFVEATGRFLASIDR